MAWDGIDRIATCTPSAPCGCSDCGSCQGLTLRTPKLVWNRPGLSTLSYRIGLHGDFKASLLSRYSSIDPALPRLTTREDADFSVGLADAFAVMAHTLTFYQERIAVESYLRTTTERYSVRELARELGYELGPGVAASTYIAFTLDTPQGQPPAQASIALGTQVQSIPGPKESPQVFETVEAVDARGEWNSLPAQTTQTLLPQAGDTSAWLAGTSTLLKPGDAILLTGPGFEDGSDPTAWYFRRIAAVQPYPAANGGSTRVDWEGALELPGGADPLEGDPKLRAFRMRANVFGYNAPLWKSIPDEMKAAYLGIAVGNLTSADEAEWPSFTIASPRIGNAYQVHGHHFSPDSIDLEAVYQEIRPGSLAVLVSPSDGPTLSLVDAAVESGRAQFGLAGKTTRLTLDPSAISPFLDEVRTTSVFAHDDLLPFAEGPARDYRVGNPLQGLPLDNGALVPMAGQFLYLQDFAPEFDGGRNIAVQGRRCRVRAPHGANALSFSFGNGDSRGFNPDESLVVLSLPTPHPTLTGQWVWSLQDDGGIQGQTTAPADQLRISASLATDDVVAEVVGVQDSWSDSDFRAVIWLDADLANVFDPAATNVLGNVAYATQGQTRTEILGSGDATVAGQSFALKQPPLTWIPSTAPGGVSSTLHVYVNGVEWMEVPSFYGRGPGEKIFVTRRDESGGTTVRFGDGLAGARPATGQNNLTARYRQGIGTGGNVKTGQLSILLNPPLGVRLATNPVPATGGDDPQTLDDARANAPLSVLTLDRVVSSEDFANFALSFAGIRKAMASWFRSREHEGVFLTVCGPGGNDPGATTLENLVQAIALAGDPNVAVRTATCRIATFALSARLSLADGYQSENVFPAVQSLLGRTFGFDARGFAQGVAQSEIAAALYSVEGVVAVVISLFQRTDDTSVDVSDLLVSASADPSTGLGAELLLLDPALVGLEVLS